MESVCGGERWGGENDGGGRGREGGREWWAVREEGGGRGMEW